MRRILSLLPLVLAACIESGDALDDPPPSPPPECLASADASFTVSARFTSNADVLFVIDDSSSMADVQARLRDAFGAFVEEVYGTGRVRVGVTTTHMVDHPLPQAGDVVVMRTAGYPYTTIGTDRSGCQDAGVERGCFRGPDAATRILDSDVLTATEMVDGFDRNADVGTCGSGSEEGSQAAGAALGATGPGGCNEGFLRPDADLVVVFVSDEDDATAGAISQVARGFTDAHPIAQTRIAVLGGIVDGEPATCRAGASTCGSACATPPPAGSQAACGLAEDCPADEYCPNGTCENLASLHWNDTNCAWCGLFATEDCCEALPAVRYLALAQFIEDRHSLDDADCQPADGHSAACVAESLCTDDLAPALRRVARSLVLERDDSDVRRRYPLPEAPAEVAGVVVRIDGAVVPASAYTIDGATLALDGELTRGQSVEVFCL